MIDADESGVSWNEERGAYVARFDEDRSPSIVVAEAIEAALPAVERPLFDYVDPDALGRLVADRDSPSVTVTFEVEGAHVTVTGDGQVLVRP